MDMRDSDATTCFLHLKKWDSHIYPIFWDISMVDKKVRRPDLKRHVVNIWVAPGKIMVGIQYIGDFESQQIILQPHTHV